MRQRASKLVRDRLGRLERTIVRSPRPLLDHPDASLTVNLDHLVALRLQTGTDLFVVQIGAFDGHSGDQLHKWIVRYSWAGILVEPQPRVFSALQQTYADQPQLDLRNVAVATTPGPRTLYTVRDDADVPGWAGQVASFDEKHVSSKGLSETGAEITESLTVECVTFAELLSGVERVDLLQIDVEGYDAELLRQFDFDTYLPAIVRFENAHLSANDHNASISRLIGYGYRVAICRRDTVAWLDPVANL